MRTTTYRYEAQSHDDADWLEITEPWLRDRLAIETPDPRDLDLIIEAMRQGDEADDHEYVFRAVRVISEADYRVVITSAPMDYDGFGTIELAAQAGTDHRDRVLRKVGIDPKHWEWQTSRYSSGLHCWETEERVADFPQLFRLA